MENVKNTMATTNTRPISNTKKQIPAKHKARINKAALTVAATGWALAFACGITSIVQTLRINASAIDETAIISGENEVAAADPLEENLSTLFSLPASENNTGRKFYSDYTAITDKTSDQYKLQTMAHTNVDSFRMIDDRYLVAVGTYFDAPCGTLLNVILENGEKIPCIVGDIIPDENTDYWNIFSADGSAVGFIVDTYGIAATKAAITGDISSNNTKWQSKVTAMYVYDETILP